MNRDGLDTAIVLTCTGPIGYLGLLFFTYLPRLVSCLCIVPGTFRNACLVVRQCCGKDVVVVVSTKIENVHSRRRGSKNTTAGKVNINYLP
jgi:hypothetical protein